jgi:hypothetical protein
MNECTIFTGGSDAGASPEAICVAIGRSLRLFNEPANPSLSVGCCLIYRWPGCVGRRHSGNGFACSGEMTDFRASAAYLSACWAVTLWVTKRTITADRSG